jgi:hypothetical protein
MDSPVKFTALKRIISYGRMGDTQQKGYQQTSPLSGDERVSLLEELRYELSSVTGNDYSQRLRRVISHSKRPQR